jgi:hypothetical protein
VFEREPLLTVPDRTGSSLAIVCENAERYRAGRPLLNLLAREDTLTSH